MLLKKEYTETLIKYQTFQNAINEFKSLTTRLDLPFATDYKVLIDKFKMNLFNELLAVDNGLKYEFENLLKTDEAKNKKVDNKINLAGYSEPAQLKRCLQNLKAHEELLNNEFYGMFRIHLQELFEQHDGSLENYLKQYIIDFAGLEKDVKLAEDYVSVLNKMINYLADNDDHKTNVVDVVNLFYGALEVKKNDLTQITSVKLDESKLYDIIKYTRGEYK